MDTKLGKFCDDFSPADSLSRYERRKQTSSYNLDCTNRFFTIVLSEDDTLESDFLFYNHPKNDQAGLQGYFRLPDSISTGKQVLGVYRPAVDEADAKRDSTGRLKSYEAEIPFWIE